MKNLIYILPAIAGAYKAVKANNTKDQLIWGGVSAIGLFMLTRSALNEDKTFSSTPLPPGANINTIVVDSMVNQLRDALSSWMFDASARCNTYAAYYKLPDADFIAVANKYKRLYKQTIRSAMSSTYQSGCGNDILWWNVYYTNWDEKVLEKMNRLNVA